MNNLHFLQRRYKQFGTTSTVEFCVDTQHRLIWLNEKSLSEVIGQIPTYRKATDKITLILGDRRGAWFPITADHVESLKPDWTRDWLLETLDLLERFYLADPIDYGEPAYREFFELTKLWE